MSSRMLVFAFCFVTILGTVGCGKKDEENAQAGSSGNALYDQHCARCHNISGSASGPKKKGPDLNKVGADPAHTVDWLAEHIRNPKAHESKSTMPAFVEQLKPEEIKSLAEFLAAKK